MMPAVLQRCSVCWTQGSRQCFDWRRVQHHCRQQQQRMRLSLLPVYAVIASAVVCAGWRWGSALLMCDLASVNVSSQASCEDGIIATQ